MTEENTSIYTTANNRPVPLGRQPGTTGSRHLNECRDLVLKQLSHALPGVLDRVDDALFQLAEKADHDNTQKLYFDAMREVRIKRPGIEKSFKEYLAAGFENSQHPQGAVKQLRQGPDFASPKLTLVDDAMLEESLAVTNTVNRIASHCKEDLFALDIRIGWLLDDTALETHDNPLSPQAICEAFAQACGGIEAATEIKLIVLKHFDNHLVAVMPGVYQAINQYLVRKDILPYIPTEIKKQSHTIHHSGPGPTNLAVSSAGVPAASGSIDAQGFCGFPAATVATSSIGPAHNGQAQIDVPTQIEPELSVQLSQELLTTLQQVMRVNGTPRPDNASVDHQLTASAANVLGRLTTLQTNPHSVACTTENADVPGGGVSLLRDLRQTELATELNHSDDLMIDVVAMMFDYIFEDENIPAPMKALIGRLQIPLLKVAMLDKGFFSRRFHPARKLLNTLAEAAVSWRQDEQGSDTLLTRMAHTVQRVLDEFETKIEVITEILAEFETFLAEDIRQAEENAWWSAKVIQGRERLASARTTVANLIKERIAVLDYCFLADFVVEHWQNLLLTTYVKDGQDSDQWQTALTTLDDLVWSVNPIADDLERARLTKRLPGLLADLKLGLSRISLPADKAQQLLAKLASIHIAQARGLARPEEADLHAMQSDALPPVSPLETLTTPANDGDDMSLVSPELTGPQQDQQQLKAALEIANQRIYEQANNQPECSGMGTTFVAAWFHHERLIVAHAGDSRLYRLRAGVLEQITLDHSLRQQMVSNGFYTMEEAKEAIAGNLVTRALGVDPEVDIETHDYEVSSGDLFLLCSDGLTDLVKDTAIEGALKVPELELETAAQTLIDLANENGGKDNISVSLVRVNLSENETHLNAKHLELLSKTDVGRRRAYNEDAQGDVINAGLVLLADGMGGYNAGEVASRLAVASVIEYLSTELQFESDTEIDAVVTQTTDTDINFTALNAMFDCTGDNEVQSSTEFPEIKLDEITDGWFVEDASQDCEEIVLESVSCDEHGAIDTATQTSAVAELEIGTWVEFRNDNDTATRARLTWISEVTGNYLFTDRQGHKVVDATPAGLALQFRRGTALCIDDVPLFERAVNHLMARLRQEP